MTKYDLGELLWVRINGQHYELLAEVVGHDGTKIVVKFIDTTTTIPHKDHPDGFKVWRCFIGTEMKHPDFKIVRRA